MSLLNKILLGAGAALALGVIIAFVWLSLVNAHLKTELARSQSLGTACLIANQDFAATTARQNKAVIALRNQGLAREKKARLTMVEAQKTIRAYTLAADRLRQIKTGGDDCAALATLFQTYLGSRP